MRGRLLMSALASLAAQAMAPHEAAPNLLAIDMRRAPPLQNGQRKAKRAAIKVKNRARHRRACRAAS